MEVHDFFYRVYSDDTDHMGIMYHANFLCVFERARSEMLRENGLSLTTMAIYDTHFAIHDIQIRYHYPARLDELLTIKTAFERRKSCSLIFKQLMYNQERTLLCSAEVHVVCVNAQLKPRALPAEFFK